MYALQKSDKQKLKNPDVLLQKSLLRKPGNHCHLCIKAARINVSKHPSVCYKDTERFYYPLHLPDTVQETQCIIKQIVLNHLPLSSHTCL